MFKHIVCVDSNLVFINTICMHCNSYSMHVSMHVYFKAFNLKYSVPGGVLYMVSVPHMY